MKKIMIPLFMIFLFSACNPGTGSGGQEAFNNPNNVNNESIQDKDGDGYSPVDGDCNDDDPNVNPAAQEVPDGIDNNCDNFIDDDYDHDGYGSATGDCDDHDPNVNPAQPEDCTDGIDNNCNGYIDDEEPDADGDGFSVCEGDCNDLNKLIGPASIEIIGDNVDNDCDGVTDNIQDPCDCRRSETTQQLMNMGSGASIGDAIGICNSNIFAQPIEVLHAASYAIISYDETGITPGATGWGNLLPIPPRKIDPEDPDLPASCQMLALFTGQPLNPTPQDDNMDLEYNCTDPVLYIDNAEPDDVPATCTDLTQVKLLLRVPGNATGFSFDFIFLSAEYPEYVGTEFNDTFYAIMGKTTSDATHINISFDGNGKAVTVNNNFFKTTLDPIITGTGYDSPDTSSFGYVGSTTGWLTTTAPAEPGSEIELIFSIHDEGDHVLDSAVVIDNFRWTTKDVEGPETVQ